MLDVEYPFEDLPLTIGNTEFSLCSGAAYLEGEIGDQDYGFIVSGIALDGNLIGDYCDKRTVRISKRSDDSFSLLLFEHLADRIEADPQACEFFYSALRDHLSEAA